MSTWIKTEGSGLLNSAFIRSLAVVVDDGRCALVARLEGGDRTVAGELTQSQAGELMVRLESTLKTKGPSFSAHRVLGRIRGGSGIRTPKNSRSG